MLKRQSGTTTADQATKDVTPPKNGKLDLYGTSGQRIKLRANFYELNRQPKFCLNQYRIDFAPDSDVTKTRKAILRENEAILNITKYVFDGASLYVGRNMEEKEYECSFESKPMVITVRRTGMINSSDDQGYQILNLIFREAMAELKLQNIKRNYYDPGAKIDVPAGNLQLWPGYLTSIRTYEENRILLCAEVTHKFMRKETVYDIIAGLMRKNPNEWRDLLSREIVGTTVLTDYTNKTYRIDDIDHATTPQSTFKNLSGQEQTFEQYYKKRYNIEIQDIQQPMLISRARERDIRAGQPENIYLVPEISRCTGLTEQMRQDFRLMREIAEHTRMDPNRRVNSLNRFNNRIQSNPKSVHILKQWELSLSHELIQIEARELPPEIILFGANKEHQETPTQRTEWNIRNGMSMVVSVECSRWVFLYPRSMEREARGFLDAFITAGAKMNYSIKTPLDRAINDDRQESYIKEIDTVAEKNPKLIIVALPTNRADRYSSIKKRCMVHYGIPCQVVLKRTMCHKNLDSVATKVAIQVNCKLGGIPWMIKLPVKGLMCVGFDVSQHPRDRSRSMGALCATMDMNQSSIFYSSTMSYRDGNEMVQNLDRYLTEALKLYKDTIQALPEKIVFYRDGVGEGQIETVRAQELQPILSSLERIYDNQKPKFAYIIVNKRVNARFFKEISNGQYVNPRPGTVIDRAVTMTDRQDFYLVSQNVGQGTVAPTYYQVLHNSTELNVDKLQILSFKLCHLYYNWSGTVRLPSVSQMAKKLAFLTSQSLQEPVHDKLKHTLYFL